MVSVESQMLPLKTKAPTFELPNHNPHVDQDTVALEDVAEGRDAVLVAFWCNHCPYVQHIRRTFSDYARELVEENVGVVAVMSNDVDQYPEDGPEEMRREAQDLGYVFPYVHDETQEVAKAYRAACTPDLFLFDGNLELAYRGQFDGSRPGNDEPTTGEDLREAVDRVLAGEGVPADEQSPSMGCNIKWAPGNEPAYFPG